MKNVKFIGFLAVSAMLLSNAVLAQRANPTKARSAGLTTTNLGIRVTAPSLTYQTATTRPASTLGNNNTYVGYTDIDFDKIDARCKNLVGQALKSYCLENECSDQSNTYMISQALPLDRTIQVLNTYTYESPSTSIADRWSGQVYVYNNSVTTMCQPYLVNLVEAYLPAFYATTTAACQDQYASSIDTYCKANNGCYNMKNFQVLEFMKANSTQDYMNSKTNDAAQTNYFFTDYCMNKLSDAARLSLINLYMPDYQEYQAGMCQRAYANAMGEYCLDEGCLEELTLNTIIKERLLNREIRVLSNNINCNTELTQEVRDSLLENIIKTENQCLRQGGVFNASRNECQWKIGIYDDANKLIDEKLFNEGETVSCSKDTFIDPFSKEGRERAEKGWAASKEAARVFAIGGGVVAGGVAGGLIGDRIADNKWLDEEIKKSLISGWDTEYKSNTVNSSDTESTIISLSNGETVSLTQEELTVYEQRKKVTEAADRVTETQRNLIKTALKNENRGYIKMLHDVEMALWGRSICQGTLTCSATTLIRSVYGIKSNKITQILLTNNTKDTTKSCEIKLVLSPGEPIVKTVNEECPTDVTPLTIANLIERADIKDNTNNSDTYTKSYVNTDTAQLAERLRLMQSDFENKGTNRFPLFDVSSDKKSINTNLFLATLTNMAGNSNITGAVVGTAVGAIGLGALGYGATELVYKLKYDKVGCYSVLDARNNDKVKKIKKSGWNKSFTLPRIMTQITQ